VDVTRYKERSLQKVAVQKSDTHRQDKIKKEERIDYYDKDNAHKYAY
jgi:hypothetical protein